MARVTTVQKSRNDYKCGMCGTDLPKGSTYRWAKPATIMIGRMVRGSKRVRCMSPKCSFRPSQMTSSGNLSTIYGAQESMDDFMAAIDDWDEDTLSSVAEVLREAGEQIREAGDSYGEGAENMSQYFGDTEQVESMREKAEACSTAADEIESAADSIESLELGEDVSAEAESLVTDAMSVEI